MGFDVMVDAKISDNRNLTPARAIFPETLNVYGICLHVKLLEYCMAHPSHVADINVDRNIIGDLRINPQISKTNKKLNVVTRKIVLHTVIYPNLRS